MYGKLIGALIIVCSSAWVGVDAARKLNRSAAQMRALQSALAKMDCEIRYAKTPYIKLCRLLCQETDEVGLFFRELSEQPGRGDYRCEGLTRSAAKKAKLNIPSGALHALEELLDGFGRYDEEGQLKLLRLASGRIEVEASRMEQDLASKSRMYRLLGACAGIALIILVI